MTQRTIKSRVKAQVRKSLYDEWRKHSGATENCWSLGYSHDHEIRTVRSKAFTGCNEVEPSLPLSNDRRNACKPSRKTGWTLLDNFHSYTSSAH